MYNPTLQVKEKPQETAGELHSSRPYHVFFMFRTSLPRDALGVPRRQPHRRSGLATLPSVGAVP